MERGRLGSSGRRRYIAGLCLPCFHACSMLCRLTERNPLAHNDEANCAAGSSWGERSVAAIIHENPAALGHVLRVARQRCRQELAAASLAAGGGVDDPVRGASDDGKVGKGGTACDTDEGCHQDGELKPHSRRMPASSSSASAWLWLSIPCTVRSTAAICEIRLRCRRGRMLSVRWSTSRAWAESLYCLYI